MTMTDVAETSIAKAATAKEITDDLHRQISEGALLPGDALPSTRELTNKYGTSTTPIRVAFGELAFAGLIILGAGTTARVARRPQQVTRSSGVHAFEKVRATIWSDEERGATGVTEFQTGLGNDLIRPTAVYTEVGLDAELATLFGVRVGEPALKRAYNTTRTEDGLPIFISTSYLLIADIDQWVEDDGSKPLLDELREPWPGGTMHQLRQVGIEIAKVSEGFSVRHPTVEERDLLEMRRGASVIDLRKIMIDTSGIVVEVAYATLPGDSTLIEHTTTLDPWPDMHNDEPDATIRHMRRGSRRR